MSRIITALSRHGPSILLIGVAVFALALVYGRGADLNFDLLNYHHFMGYSVLEGRYENDLAPAGLQTFLNPYWNVVSFTANSYLAFPWNAWLLASIQLLSLLALLGIWRELERGLGLAQPSLEGALALGLCLLAPIWWSELGTSFFSSSTAPLVLGALWLALRGVAQPERPGTALLWALSGLLAGLATGLKLTNGVFALALAFCLIPLVTAGHRLGALRWGLVFALGAALGFGSTAWWNLYLWREWDSPLFPFYNGLFESPYFASSNWRDLRWRFGSPGDFVAFLGEAWRGTQKTLELQFADARMALAVLLGAIALLAGAWRRIRVPASQGPREKVPDSLLWFAAAALLAWAWLFAYQRYLIPLELAAGFVIWILARRVFRPDAVVAVLVLAIGLSAFSLQVPDWGHNRGLRGAGAARFGLDLPDALATSPALYLVLGHANSYVFPFLHGGSRFLKADFSPQMEGRLRARLASDRGLPLRLLTFEGRASELTQLAERLGIPTPDQAPWRCQRFRSALHRLIACEVVAAPTKGGEVPAFEGTRIDFRGAEALPPEVLWVAGLGEPEPWGTWSIADEVVLAFARCLPQGGIEIGIQGHGFGPNIGQPIPVAVGAARSQVALGGSTALSTARMVLGPGCERELRLRIPSKTSPQALGQGADRRELGVGLVSLTLRALPADAEAGDGAQGQAASQAGE